MKAYSLWKTNMPFPSDCLRLWFSYCRSVADHSLGVSSSSVFLNIRDSQICWKILVEELFLVKSHQLETLIRCPLTCHHSNQDHLDHFISHQTKLQSRWKKQHAKNPALRNTEFCRSVPKNLSFFTLDWDGKCTPGVRNWDGICHWGLWVFCL